MSLIVENGTGVPGAESYQTVAGYKAWADARGYTYGSDALIEQALRRATAYIDGAFRSRFGGVRTGGRLQALEYPRYGSYDAAGYEIATDALPAEIVAATNEGTKRELEKPGSLAPDIKAGGGVLKRVKAGAVELEYAGNGTSSTTFRAIEYSLSGLLRMAALGGDIPIYRA